MRKPILLLTLTFVVFSCSQSSKSESELTDSSDSVASSNAGAPLTKSINLDSLDRAHNASIVQSGDEITKATVSLSDGDSTINLVANIKRDHRIFGFAKPEVTSEKLLLFSVFTPDVEGNPFGCKLGAYYDTSGMDGLTLQYKGITGDFVEAQATGISSNPTTVYFEKKWIEIE